MRRPRRRKPSAEGTAYDPELIGRRVNDRRIELGLEVKDLLDELGWDKSEYTRKITNGETPVWLGEWARLRDRLHGWRGFPFITQAEGQLLEAVGDRVADVLKFLATTPPGGIPRNRSK